jgi:N-acyl amino acid synthase of PEP-CTERM/exosortase system
LDSYAAVVLAAKDRKAIDPLTRFNTCFRTSSADTPELIQAAFALRYQVYCLERKFEDAAQHADFLEKDVIDYHSVHSLIFYRPRAEPIGTVRIILTDPRSDELPIQQLLRRHGIDPSAYIQNKITGEISRFAISKELRRRHPSCMEGGVKQSSERQFSLPCLGLIQNILRHSLELGISNWAAVMEPQLFRMLASLGIRFTPIGPLVVHHGLRQSSICNVPQMLKVLKYEKPENWSVVTNDGELFYPTETSIYWQGYGHVVA